MKINSNSIRIKDVTTHLGTFDILSNNRLEVFSFIINANDFDYKNATEQLLESVAEFALSRKINKEYKDKPLTLSKKAREKFRDYAENKGELGEFFLYCFLEGHLGAPKILSKLELKTAKNMYVNGADGLHYLKLVDGNYHLIFGESKVEKKLTDGLRHAFESISDFKKGKNKKDNDKSGIMFERGLLNSNLDREIEDENEKLFLKSIIYPSTKSGFDVDDAFGIFVGFEFNYSDLQKLSNNDFRVVIKEKIIEATKKQIKNINKYVENYKLFGHTFYIYVLPFANIEDDREMILKELLS